MTQAAANTEQNAVAIQAGSYVNITTATTTDVCAQACILKRVCINGGTAGAVTIYDESTGGTTTTLGVIAAAAAATPSGVHEFNVRMANGIQVVTAANTDVTVVFEKR